MQAYLVIQIEINWQYPETMRAICSVCLDLYKIHWPPLFSVAHRLLAPLILVFRHHWGVDEEWRRVTCSRPAVSERKRRKCPIPENALSLSLQPLKE